MNSIHGGGATVLCIHEIVDDQIEGASTKAVRLMYFLDWAAKFTSSWLKLNFHIDPAVQPVSRHTSADADVMLPLSRR